MPITALFSLANLSSVSAIVTLAAGYMKQHSKTSKTFMLKHSEKPCTEILKHKSFIILLTVHESLKLKKKNYMHAKKILFTS